MAAGAEPEHIVVVDVEEDREQGAAGFSTRPASAAQRRRIIVLSGLGDDLRPVIEEPPPPRRQRRHLAVRPQEMPQIDTPGLDHARLSE